VRFRRLTMLLGVLLLAALALSSGGCNAVGAAVYKINGPPDNPAKYTPAKTPMLVLVENYQQQTAASPQADILARDLFGLLDAHSVAPMIPPEKLQELRDEKPVEFPTMPINKIGQAAGASQVLYVQLAGGETHAVSGGEGYQGVASATVKIIDAATGDTIWPHDADHGYPVSASTKMGIDAVQSPAALQHKLYTQLADEIGRLFYKWKPDDMRPEGFNE